MKKGELMKKHFAPVITDKTIMYLVFFQQMHSVALFCRSEPSACKTKTFHSRKGRFLVTVNKSIKAFISHVRQINSILHLPEGRRVA